MSIAIVTDSAADIPADLLKKNNITEVPVIVNFGDESFKENVDLSADDFYERLQNSKEFPTTSQPAVGDFIDIYSNLAKKHDSIISIHISSKLSGTFNSAEQAAKEVGNSKCNISVIDTLSVSMGTGLIALEIAKSVKAGMKAEDAVNYAYELSGKGKIFVAVSTLEYLKKGGRINGAAALFGGIL
ncbi:MAG TPA: DegV family protein, partial [Dehalococcoidia bacterium]|nr:DegV family protein [Dehalococcoidia bacterium]